MKQYKVLGADGQEYGPVDADALRQWIVQRRAVRATKVKGDDDREWRPLRSFAEFADALATVQQSSMAGEPASGAQPPKGAAKTSRLAIASLICGILGFLLLPAMVGVARGALALARIRRSKGQLRGQGLAIAGMALSAVMMMGTIPAGLVVSALAKAKAESVQCSSNLRQIALAARTYSSEHKGTLPTCFLTLSNEMGSPNILWCAADHQRCPTASWAEFDPRRNLTYEYLRPWAQEAAVMPGIVLRCPKHNVEVCLGDGLAHAPAIAIPRSPVWFAIDESRSLSLVPLIVIEDTPLNDAILNLARQMELNVILDPRVPGSTIGPGSRIEPPRVNCRYEKLTIRQALDRVLKDHNLVLIDNPATTIARIAPAAAGVKPVPAARVFSDTNGPCPLAVVEDSPLAAMIRNVAQQMHLNVSVDPAITAQVAGYGGTVSFRWEKVTMPQMLVAVLDNFDLVAVEDTTTSTVRIIRKPAGR
jgi:hypothetical protein